MQSHYPIIRRFALRALVGAILLVAAAPSFATTNPAFVDRAFQDLLLRPASPSDLSTFVPLLDSATLTRTQFALNVMNTDEYRHVRVNEFFNDYLGRTPSSLDLTSFTTLLQSVTLPQGRAAIFGSPEYFATQGGSTNAGFLNALFLDLLNRPIDPTASAAFQSALAGGATRTDVAMSVMGSDEWRGDIVNSYYQQFLHRSADPTGLAGFKSFLSSGGTEQEVIASLIGSQEYFNNVPEPAALSILAAFVPFAMRRRR
jgi:hypothetical protein